MTQEAHQEEAGSENVLDFPIKDLPARPAATEDMGYVTTDNVLRPLKFNPSIELTAEVKKLPQEILTEKVDALTTEIIDLAREMAEVERKARELSGAMSQKSNERAFYFAELQARFGAKTEQAEE